MKYIFLFDFCFLVHCVPLYGDFYMLSPYLTQTYLILDVVRCDNDAKGENDQLVMFSVLCVVKHIGNYDLVKLITNMYEGKSVSVPLKCFLI
jgi:hypothetical protein